MRGPLLVVAVLLLAGCTDPAPAGDDELEATAVASRIDVAVEPARKDVPLGEGVNIRWSLLNLGSLPTNLTQPITVRGTAGRTVDVQLVPGETSVVEYFFNATTPGVHNVSFAGKSAVIRVLVPGVFIVDRLEASPLRATVGDTVTVSYSVRNGGDLFLEDDVQFLLDDQELRVETIAVGGSETVTAKFTFLAAERGPHVLHAGQQKLSLVFLQDATFPIPVVKAPTTPVPTGSEVTLRVDVSNIGDKDGDIILPLEVDGTVVETVRQALKAGEKRTLEIPWTPLKHGVYAVRLGHAAPVTIVVKNPAEFRLRDLQVTPRAAAPGQNLVLSLNVDNVGELPGDRTVRFTVNGAHQAEQTFEIDGGASKLVTFTWNSTAPGPYKLAVEGLDPVDVRVLRPAEFLLSGFSLSSTQVPPNTPANARVLVRNTGELPGDKVVQLTVNGAVVDQKSVRVEPGAEQYVEIPWSSGTPGFYQVGIVGASSGSLKVLRPPEFSTTGTTLSTTTVEPGETVLVRATVHNTGEMAGDKIARLMVDGITKAERIVRVEPGSFVNLEIPWSSTSPGTYQVTIDDAPALALKVLRPAEASYGTTSLSTSSVSAGDSVTASATVTNVGEMAGTFSVTLAVQGSPVGTQTVTLNPGASTIVSFTFTAVNGGSNSVTVGTGEAATLQVNLPQLRVSATYTDPWCSDYTDITVTITNDGSGVAREVSVMVRSGWQAKETTIGSISPGVSRSVTLRLSLDDSCGSSDYYDVDYTATPKYGSSATGTIIVDL